MQQPNVEYSTLLSDLDKLRRLTEEIVSGRHLIYKAPAGVDASRSMADVPSEVTLVERERAESLNSHPSARLVDRLAPHSSANDQQDHSSVQLSQETHEKGDSTFGESIALGSHTLTKSTGEKPENATLSFEDRAYSANPARPDYPRRASEERGRPYSRLSPDPKRARLDNPPTNRGRALSPLRTQRQRPISPPLASVYFPRTADSNLLQKRSADNPPRRASLSPPPFRGKQTQRSLNFRLAHPETEANLNTTLKRGRSPDLRPTPQHRNRSRSPPPRRRSRSPLPRERPLERSANAYDHGLTGDNRRPPEPRQDYRFRSPSPGPPLRPIPIRRRSSEEEVELAMLGYLRPPPIEYPRSNGSSQQAPLNISEPLPNNSNGRTSGGRPLDTDYRRRPDATPRSVLPEFDQRTGPPHKQSNAYPPARPRQQDRESPAYRAEYPAEARPPRADAYYPPNAYYPTPEPYRELRTSTDRAPSEDPRYRREPPVRDAPAAYGKPAAYSTLPRHPADAERWAEYDRRMHQYGPPPPPGFYEGYLPPPPVTEFRRPAPFPEDAYSRPAYPAFVPPRDGREYPRDERAYEARREQVRYASR